MSFCIVVLLVNMYNKLAYLLTLRSALEQATYICVPVTKQYNLLPAVICLAGKVTAGLVENNGSQRCFALLSFELEYSRSFFSYPRFHYVTRGLTAKKPGSSPCSTLVIASLYCLCVTHQTWIPQVNLQF